VIGRVECPRCGAVSDAAEIWLWINGQGERLQIEAGRIQQSGHVSMFDLACGCKFDTELWRLSVSTQVSTRGSSQMISVTPIPAVEAMSQRTAEIARAGEQRVEFAGYVVAGHDGGPILKIDWDGDVHATPRDGEIELLACRRAGYSDYRLYGLIEIGDSGG
jgi:hypothetical protein